MNDFCRSCINKSELCNPDIDRICDDCENGSLYKKDRILVLEDRNKKYCTALIELYKDASILAAEDVRGLILKTLGIEKGCSSCWNSDFHRDPDSVCEECEDKNKWVCDFTDFS